MTESENHEDEKSAFVPPEVFFASAMKVMSLSTAANLMLVSKQWRAIVQPCLRTICVENYRSLLSHLSVLHKTRQMVRGSKRLVSICARAAVSSSREDPDECWTPSSASLDPVTSQFGVLMHARILSALEALELAYWRTPGTPYRKSLKPFTDGSLFSTPAASLASGPDALPSSGQDQGQGQERLPWVQFAANFQHLLDLFSFSSMAYDPGRMPVVSRVNLRIWVMYMVLDFCRAAMPSDIDMRLRSVTLDKAQELEREVRKQRRRFVFRELWPLTAQLRQDLRRLCLQAV
jgi:hypothetical protein